MTVRQDDGVQAGIFYEYFGNVITAVSEKGEQIDGGSHLSGLYKGIVCEFSRAFQPEIFESNRSLRKVAEQANVEFLEIKLCIEHLVAFCFYNTRYLTLEGKRKEEHQNDYYPYNDSCDFQTFFHLLFF